MICLVAHQAIAPNATRTIPRRSRKLKRKPVNKCQFFVKICVLEKLLNLGDRKKHRERPWETGEIATSAHAHPERDVGNDGSVDFERQLFGKIYVGNWPTGARQIALAYPVSFNGYSIAKCSATNAFTDVIKSEPTYPFCSLPRQYNGTKCRTTRRSAIRQHVKNGGGLLKVKNGRVQG